MRGNSANFCGEFESCSGSHENDPFTTSGHLGTAIIDRSRAKCHYGEMNPISRFSLVALALIAVSSTVGCAAASETAAVETSDPTPTQVVEAEPEVADTSAPPEPAPTPTPEATPTPTPDAPAMPPLATTFTMTDVDGYSIEVDVAYELRGIEVVPTNDKPGFTSIHLSTAGRLDLTNTTAGRELTFERDPGASSRRPFVGVYAVYNAQSPVCVNSARTLLGDPISGSDYEDLFCSVPLFYGKIENQMAVNSSERLSLISGALGTQGKAGLGAVPEASVEDVKAALLTPAGYFVSYLSLDYERWVPACGSAGNLGQVWSSVDSCERMNPTQPVT